MKYNFSVLTLVLLGISKGYCYQYDYGSIRHSMNVLTELVGEIVPLLEKYKINVNIDQGPVLHKDLLTTYFKTSYNHTLNQNRYLSQNEGSRCHKKFDSRDYLEFHWKVRHSPFQISIFNDTKSYENFPLTPIDLQPKAKNLGLADLCGIVEGNDYPEMTTRYTAYNQRDFYGYKYRDDEITDIRLNKIKRINSKATKFLPKFDDLDIMEDEGQEKIFKFTMRRYNDREKAFMLNKGITLFSTCLVNQGAEHNQRNLLAAYDILYFNYGKKFETNHFKTVRPNLLEYNPDFYKIESGAKWKEEEDTKSMWQLFKILGVIGAFIMTLLYYLGIYLLKYDTGDY